MACIVLYGVIDDVKGIAAEYLTASLHGALLHAGRQAGASEDCGPEELQAARQVAHGAHDSSSRACDGQLSHLRAPCTAHGLLGKSYEAEKGRQTVLAGYNGRSEKLQLRHELAISSSLSDTREIR